MERCPFCQARLNENQCGRCQAELSRVLLVEQAALFWLSISIHEWAANRKESGLKALARSLGLKKNKLAIVFREFLIERECRSIIDLMAGKQILAAKQHIYELRLLLPHSQLLQELNLFTDYFLLKSIPKD
jgi:hypothetical protein